MQFSLSRQIMQNALDQIQFAFQPSTYRFSENHQGHFREYLKISLHDGQLTFALANEHVYATSMVMYDEGTSGDVLIPYSALRNLLACWQGGTLHFQYDGTQAILSGEKMTLIIRDCPDARRFPLHPKQRYAQTLLTQKAVYQHSWELILPASTLQHMVRMVVCAAAAPAQDSGVLQGALLRVHDDILTLVAADQVHMHLMETSVPGAGTWDVTPAVPASLLVQAIQGIARTEDVRISTMTTLQQKRDGAIYNELPFLVLKMSSREIYITPTESYPDAFAIIPKEFAMHATCETSELRNALTKINQVTHFR